MTPTFGEDVSIGYMRENGCESIKPTKRTPAPTDICSLYLVTKPKKQKVTNEHYTATSALGYYFLCGTYEVACPRRQSDRRTTRQLTAAITNGITTVLHSESKRVRVSPGNSKDGNNQKCRQHGHTVLVQQICARFFPRITSHTRYMQPKESQTKTKSGHT